MAAKECPKCQNQHNKPGTFCSRRCANSRVFSAASRLKKSLALRGRKRPQFAAMADPNSPERKKWRQRVQNSWRQKYQNTPFEQLGKDSKRRRVFEEQNFACDNCKLNTWCGAPITLELDHDDGNNRNDARTNLRGICPNCHSLTKTWRGRNKKNTAVPDTALLVAINAHGNIHRGLHAVGLTPKGKNYTRAKRLMEIGAPGVAPGSQN